MQAGALIQGKYRLSRKLGSGAMGEVWAALNVRTGREVALKFLLSTADAEQRRRLLREALACGQLDHRNIVQVFDVGETEQGEPFLVMQLLLGTPLDKHLKDRGPLAQREAVPIAVDVARALRAAHDKRIYHRDLKPANIFLHEEQDSVHEGALRMPTVKVLDFGVSKISNAEDGVHTAVGAVLGSPAYMSPEQAMGRSDDPRVDLWSLGVVLFEMLAKRRPLVVKGFNVEGIQALLYAPIPRVESLAPAVDTRLGDVIARCLERDPARRVGSAKELIDLLRPFDPRDQPSMLELAAPPTPAPWREARESDVATMFVPPRSAPTSVKEARDSAATVLYQTSESSRPTTEMDRPPPPAPPIPRAAPVPAVAADPAPPAPRPALQANGTLPLDGPPLRAPAHASAPESIPRSAFKATMPLDPAFMAPSPASQGVRRGEADTSELAKTAPLTPEMVQQARAEYDARRAAAAARAEPPMLDREEDSQGRRQRILLGLSVVFFLAMVAVLVGTLSGREGRGPAGGGSAAPAGSVGTESAR